MKTHSIAASAIMSGLLLLAGCTGVSQFAGKAASTTTTTTGSTTTTSTCQSIAVPIYIYPSYLGSGWNTAISDAPFNPKVKRILIMNPDSGPGTAANSDYQNIVATVHKAGGLVYGYVYTNYGAVAIASAEAQVSQYKTWYGVDGIFVDATSALTPLASTYYQPLANYITSNISGGGVMLNVGTYPDPSYAAITVPASSALTINVFEDDYATYASAGGIPAWATGYPASLFVNIVYNTSAAQLANALTLSVQRNVGTVYFTDGTLPNPYGQLPSYWSQLASQTQAGCQ
jgi:hypothetical protein